LFTTNSTSLRIAITIIAANSYDISVLELQSLREIVTISQSWNYKHCHKYFECLIVRITIIAGNSYNISDCKQTLAPPFSSTKIHAFLANSAQRSYLSSKFEQHGTESTAHLQHRSRLPHRISAQAMEVPVLSAMKVSRHG
jgi:hypothetical protein